MKGKTSATETLGRLHDVPSIAVRWNCSEKHVRRLIQQGQLIAHRIGRLVRVTEADLLSYERSVRGLQTHQTTVTLSPRKGK